MGIQQSETSFGRDLTIYRAAGATGTDDQISVISTPLDTSTTPLSRAVGRRGTFTFTRSASNTTTVSVNGITVATLSNTAVGVTSIFVDCEVFFDSVTSNCNIITKFYEDDAHTVYMAAYEMSPANSNNLTTGNWTMLVSNPGMDNSGATPKAGCLSLL